MQPGTKSSSRSTAPPVLVVGACAHGLAIVRALARHGVVVHVLEANPALPGTLTRHAHIHFVEDINGPGLIHALRDWRSQHEDDLDPVLYLTNDNMVQQVSANWSSLAEMYRLSWSDSVDTVNRFLSKAVLAEHCATAGLRYPASVTLASADELDRLRTKIEFPITAKPIRPLSGFKVERLHSISELRSLVEKHIADLPILLQQWIAGGDNQLRFCALYLDRGTVIARFDGQKLRSRRPALGGTTAAIPRLDEDLYQTTLAFFRCLGLSGPVSLEIKRDSAGRDWVIEPTVGRTDYWLGCCVANGVDLPYIEYCHQAKLPIPETKQQTATLWCDTEHDPWARIALIFHPSHNDRLPLKTIYPYLDRSDWAPFFKSLWTINIGLMKRIAARVAAPWFHRSIFRDQP